MYREVTGDRTMQRDASGNGGRLTNRMVTDGLTRSGPQEDLIGEGVVPRPGDIPGAHDGDPGAEMLGCKV